MSHLLALTLNLALTSRYQYFYSKSTLLLHLCFCVLGKIIKILKVVFLRKFIIAVTLKLFSLKKQDTLKSSPPENETMKKANRTGIFTMTIIFLLCSCSGYAAFGPLTPGSILMGSGFHEPFWLIDLANVFIVVHLVGAYQVS